MTQGLLRSHRAFRRLWVGDGLSKIGSQISLLAIPVLAVTVLDASTWQVALLSTCAWAPVVLIGLPVGAWADRRRRRSVLVLADVLRAVALASVPLAAVLDRLTIGQLYVVEFLVGVGTVVFDVFHGAYVPGLVGRASLVQANSRLELNRTLGFTAGPAVAGQIIAWLGAALAPLASVAGFCWSAGWIASVRATEPPPPGHGGHSVSADIREGLRFVLQEPFVRATTLYSCAAVACLSTRYAVETLFLVRTVGLDPAWIGLVLTAAGVGTVLGALAAGSMVRRIGELPTVAGSALAMGLSSLLIPLTTPGPGLALYVLGTGLVGFWIMVNGVVSVSRRQRVCPDHLLGRMTATSRFLSWATLPLGGVLGGLIGTAVGVRTTLWLTAGGLVLSAALFARALAGAPSATPGDNKVPLHA